jgi:hypothetical protein
MLLVHVQLRHQWDIARILMIVRSLSSAMGSINIYINVETALFGTSIFLLVDMDLKCTIVSDNFVYILSINPSIHIQINKKSVHPAIVLFMIVLSFTFEIFLMFLMVCLYMNCHWISSYQRGKISFPLPDLTTPHCCACPILGHVVPTSCNHGPFCDQWVKGRGVNIGWIVDHHCFDIS